MTEAVASIMSLDGQGIARFFGDALEVMSPASAAAAEVRVCRRVCR